MSNVAIYSITDCQLILQLIFASLLCQAPVIATTLLHFQCCRNYDYMIPLFSHNPAFCQWFWYLHKLTWTSHLYKWVSNLWLKQGITFGVVYKKKPCDSSLDAWEGTDILVRKMCWVGKWAVGKRLSCQQEQLVISWSFLDLLVQCS